MKNLNIYFPSLDEKCFSRGLYTTTRNDLGTYGYFKAEYGRAIPYDPERDMMDCVVENKSKFLLEKLKSKLISDNKLSGSRSVVISQGTTLYSFFKSEFRGNPFSQDIDKNILIPYESYEKIKTRK